MHPQRFRRNDPLYPLVQVLQRLFARALPDLHLPGLADVRLPLDHTPLAAAPCTPAARVQAQSRRGPRSVHGAEHAAELLPGHWGAEGRHFTGARHAAVKTREAVCGRRGAMRGGAAWGLVCVLCVSSRGQTPPLFGEMLHYKPTKEREKKLRTGEDTLPSHWKAIRTRFAE